MKKFLKSFAVFALVFSSPLIASAGVSYQFAIGSNSGTLTYENQHLIGSGINIDNLYVDTNTADMINGTNFSVTAGKLDFDVQFTHSLAIPGTIDFEHGTQGSMNILGSITGGPAHTLLSSNIYNSNAIFQFDPSKNSVSFSTNFGTSGLDSEIDSALGLSDSTVYQPTSLKINFNVPDNFFSFPNNNPTFESIVSSGDVSGQAPVPLPAAAWFLISGIVGLAGLKKRNKE